MVALLISQMCVLCDITRVVFFKDQINSINASGIVVVFMGVFLYKASLHFSKTEAEANTLFSRVTGNDLYEEEIIPHSHDERQDNLDPNNAMSFTIDDEDNDEGIGMTTDVPSTLHGQDTGSTFEQEGEKYGKII